MARKSEKYEETFEKLRDIVDEIEKDNIPLDEAMKKYEDGVKLCNKLYAMLNNYEKKIHILNDNGEEEVFKK